LARHHVVIGDGAVAAAFAALAPLDPGDALTVVGPGSGQLGRGLAYADHPPDAPWRDAYLLNSPAGTVDPAFPDWVAERWPEVAARKARHPRGTAFDADAIAVGDHAALFLPRAVFGDYLRDRTDAALAAHHARGVRVALRPAIVTDLARDGDRFRLTLSDGRQMQADNVDVATGGPATARFGADTGPTAFEQPYGNEAAIAAALRPHSLRPDAVVLCLGANAAMLDVLRLLQCLLPEFLIRMAVLSPSGLLPEPLIWTRPRGAPVTPGLRGPYPDAEGFLAAVDADLAAHRAKGARMAELRRGYRTYLDHVGLATLIPDIDQRRRVIGPLDRRFRRGTADSLADFDRLHHAGQIRIIRAKVDYVVAGADRTTRVRVTSPDGSSDLSAPIVINCAGPDPQAHELMTAGLISRGWIEKVGQGLRVGARLETRIPGLRYLSPAVTEIGDEVIALPLYDVDRLTTYVRRASRAI